MKDVALLSQDEIKSVTGGGVSLIKPEPVMAEDMYGNKLTPQEYMDFQLGLAFGHGDPHDFDSWDGTRYPPY